MFGEDDIPQVPEDWLKEIINLNNPIAFASKLADEPKLEILTQPKQRGYRFRYVSEGNTHGGIPGEDSAKGSKSSPTIQIQNYSGKAAICINLVSVDDPPKLHAHNLVGKNVQNGMYYCEHDKKEWVLKITNLGIQHVTKKDLVNVLHEKLLQGHKLNLFAEKNQSTQSFDIATLIDSFGPTDVGTDVDEAFAKLMEAEETKKIRKEAETLAKEIDLSAVRLLISAFLPDEDGRLTKALPPVVSGPIYDAKAAHAGQLKICRMSCSSSSVVGNEEVFLLCDKVQKDDIEVRLFQQDKAGNVTWEDFGRFAPNDVHKQAAIVFRTPPYVDRGIQKPVTVNIQLKRKKDGECSDPKPFIYKPGEFDKYKIGEKRRKELPEDLEKILKGKAVKQFRPSASASSSSSSQSSETFHNTTGIKFFKPSNH